MTLWVKNLLAFAGQEIRWDAVCNTYLSSAEVSKILSCICHSGCIRQSTRVVQEIKYRQKQLRYSYGSKNWVHDLSVTKSMTRSARRVFGVGAD